MEFLDDHTLISAVLCTAGGTADQPLFGSLQFIVRTP